MVVGLPYRLCRRRIQTIRRGVMLCSKGMVLNVQVKILLQQYQVGVKKLNLLEPLMKCRNGSLSCKS